MTRPTRLSDTMNPLGRPIPYRAASASALAALALHSAQGAEATDAAAIPSAGEHMLVIVAPDLLELRIAATRRGAAARPTHADWIDDGTRLPNGDMPAPGDLAVTVDGTPAAVAAIGFKRSVRYAALGGSDFTIANSLFVALEAAMPPGAGVTVVNPAADKWPASFTFAAAFDPDRRGPALHANQVGHEIGSAKRARVGYWLGDLGELPIPIGTAFEIVDDATGAISFSGTLSQRPDTGYTYTPAPFQRVFEADFTPLDTPGSYRLRVPGLGSSLPFEIRAGLDGAHARNDAAGFYHQRSGEAKALPYTRHTDAAGHTAPAAIPSNSDRAAFAHLWDTLQYQTEGAITGPADLLYPFGASGSVDVSGGHHDAGDYGKYTANSAAAVHALTFAVDHTAAVMLDNLGLPESGDGIPDVLQIAAREAAFLAKMQDTDGGFYQLVRPRDRSFETDALPSAGDPQVVYPKNTSATAAAVAALAELGSSPAFASYYPAEAAAYLAAATGGWAFLQNAIASHGLAGAYQPLVSAGDGWGHDDELAWAAAALFAATGDATYQAALMAYLPAARLTQNPGDPSFGDIREFGFRRAVAGWGCALRAYTFAADSGRIAATAHDPAYLAACRAELSAAADDIVARTAANAYGAAFAPEFKADGSAAYFFPVSEAFDTLAGRLLAPAEAGYLDAVRQNLDYNAGANPADIPFSTGLGWHRQREIVSQFSHNDDAVLPPLGIPLGAITVGPPYLDDYRDTDGGNLLARSLYPNTGAFVYPYYERWSDSYAVSQEMTIPVLARQLAVTASLFADGPLATQPWNASAATITGLPANVSVGTTYNLTLSTPLPDTGARTTWDATALDPHHGATFPYTPARPGPNHVAADLLLPDGRRAHARALTHATLAVPNPIESYADPAGDDDVVAWYQLDGDFSDATGLQADMAPNAGGEAFDPASFTWANRTPGQALRLDGPGAGATVGIPHQFLDGSRATAVSVEAMVLFDAYHEASTALLQLRKPGTSAELIWGFDQYLGPFVNAGTQNLLGDLDLVPLYEPDVWHHLKVETGTSPFAGHRVWIDGQIVREMPSPEFFFWESDTDAQLTFGGFNGWIDEVVVRAAGAVHPPIVSLYGEETARLRVGDSWTDPEGEASDYLGSPLPLTVTGSVDTAVPGTYTLTYTATDADGRTGSATRTVRVEVPPLPGERVAIYRFDGDTGDSLARQSPLAPAGSATVSGGTLALPDPTASASLGVAAQALFEPGVSFGFAIELELGIDAFAAGDSALLELTMPGGSPALSLMKLDGDPGLSLHDGVGLLAAAAALGLETGTHHIRLVLTLDAYELWVDGALTASIPAPGEVASWVGGDAALTLGSFTGSADDLVLTNIHPAVFGTRLERLHSASFAGLGDERSATIPQADLFSADSIGLAIEGHLLIGALPGFGVDTAKLLSLTQNWDTDFAVARDTWSQQPGAYAAFLGEIVPPAVLAPLVPALQETRVVLRLDTEGYQLWAGDRLVAQIPDTAALERWRDHGDATFSIGGLDGAIQHPRAVRLENPPEDPYAVWAFYHIADHRHRLPEQDADADGYTNLEEYAFGSDPDDPNSIPEIVLLSNTAAENCIDFPTANLAATVVTVEESVDLRHWTPIESEIITVENDGSTSLNRALLPRATRRYYRLTVTGTP